MATAAHITTTTTTSSSSDEDEVLPTEISKEQNNKTRLQLFLSLGQKALLNNFHNNDIQSFSRDPHLLYLELKEKKPKINRLKNQRVIKQDQYELLIPPSGDKVDSTKFDITLLMVLLTNFCGFRYPTKNWIPQTTDTDTFANIVRVKRLRDQMAHLTNVSDADLEQMALLFEQPLLALGVSQQKIDNVLKMRIIDEDTKNTWQKYKQSQTSFNHNFIPPVANFFRRDKELGELHDKLTKSFGSKFGTVFCGFPGVGKSETVRQYWVKYGQSSFENIIVWLNAENAATMESGFQDIGDECGIHKIKKPDGKFVETNKLVDIVYRHFAANLTTSPRKVLFVFDGADDQNVLNQFLPKSVDYAPYILITSQSTSWDKRFNNIELDVFSNEDALQFLLDNILETQYINDEELKDLIREMSCHPLALQQAFSYINNNLITVEEYMSLLSQHNKEMLSEGPEQLGNPSVNNTMTISINRLRTIDPSVVDLLNILAHLDGKEIKKGFLLMIFNNNMFTLNKKLSLLRKYSIVNFDTDTKMDYNDQVIRIHSLTQRFLESNQTNTDMSNQLEKIAKIFIKDLEDCVSTKVQDGKYWLNHFYKIYENEVKKPLFLDFFLENQNLIIDLFETKGNYYKLLEIFQYISQRQKEIHGEKNLVYLKTTCYLAHCLLKVNQTKKAFDLIKNTVDLQRLSDDNYLLSKNVLASCFLQMEKFDKACQLFQEVEEVQQKTLCSTHPYYLTTKNNLAGCFLRMKKFDKACQLFQEVEVVQQKTLCSTHPYYLTTKNNLAGCFLQMEKFDKACQLFQEVEKVQQKTLCSTHPYYLTTKNNLAGCFLRMKKFDKACQLFQEVEVVQQKTLCSTHPQYLTTKNNLASCFLQMEKFDKACQLFQEVEVVQQKTLCSTHPYYLTTKNNLAGCFLRMKKFDKACQLFQEVEVVQQKTLCSTHPYYLTTKNNLADCFLGMKKFDKACQLFQEVEVVQQKTLCSTHPDYLTTKNNLAGCFLQMKKFDKACQLFQEVEVVQQKTLCSTHPDYLTTKNNLAGCFFEIKKFDKACQLFREVGETLFQTLGPTDPQYLNTKSNLAGCFLQMKEFDEACQLCREILDNLKCEDDPELYGSTENILQFALSHSAD